MSVLESPYVDAFYQPTRAVVARHDRRNLYKHTWIYPMDARGDGGWVGIYSCY